MGDRGVAVADEDPRRDAVRWARRYGKNCLDSRASQGPGLRELAANIAAPQGPAGKAHAGKGAAVVHKGAAVDESVPTAELGSPSAAQATRKIDSSSEPTATTNSGAAIELLSTEELKAAVDSIPSYVERATMLWILVPPTTHRDVDGAVCDVSGTSTATSRRARFGSLVVRRIGLSGGSSGTSSLARYGRTAFITAAATA